MAGPTLADLASLPIVSAPMAGGPTTVELVQAVAAAGGVGFLASGYKTAEAMRDDIARVRDGAMGAFGVNVFVPGAPTSQPTALRSYLDEIAPEADRLGTALGEPRWDDDDWQAKIAQLLKDAVPCVSFTFGCPSRDIVAALQDRGTFVIATVTTVDEAAMAASTGVDALCAQGIEAGAHRGTFDNLPGAHVGLPLLDLVDALAASVALPVIAAGGVMDADDVSEALAAGAAAVQCGTAFLLSDESGTNPAHRGALVDERYTETAITRAFSGRPARGLRNAFIRDHDGAPAAYPEINNATRPLRAAAATKGDTDRMSLWAGTGWRRARPGAAGEIVERLAAGRRVTG